MRKIFFLKTTVSVQCTFLLPNLRFPILLVVEILYGNCDVQLKPYCRPLSILAKSEYSLCIILAEPKRIPLTDICFIYFFPSHLYAYPTSVLEPYSQFEWSMSSSFTLFLSSLFLFYILCCVVSISFSNRYTCIVLFDNHSNHGSLDFPSE